MKRRGVKETDPYDWEKLEAGVHSINLSGSQNNMPSNIQSHIQLKTDQMVCGAGVIGGTGNVTTIGATNASGIEYVRLNENNNKIQFRNKNVISLTFLGASG